ncbi:MAG TPA: DUF4173 domain-containing protein [Longilinea sp.]|nr:DUF4173 domain-containing protein [Longilinea sp.]
MLRRTWFLWLMALIVGWGFDLLFWNHIGGLGYFLWTAIILLSLFTYTLCKGVKPSWRSILLGVLTLAAAFIVFWRSEPVTILAGVGLSLFLGGLLFTTFNNGYWIFYRIRDFFMTFLRWYWAAFSRPFGLKQELPPVEGEALTPKRKIVGSLILGVILALPVVLVLTALLASADMIFSQRLQEFFTLFDLEHLPEYLFRLFYVVFVTFLMAGSLLHAAAPKHIEDHPLKRQETIKPFLGSIETMVILVSVTILFLIFVVIQFQYLFGGEANINAAGYTYSEYAVKGFSELVAVAVISLLLYQGLATISRRESSGQRTAFTVFSALMMGLVLVILVSSFQRLALYENAYGFSRLRAYTHFFIPWLGVLILAVIGLEIARRQRWFALSLLVCTVGFGATLAIVNVDGFIARQNLIRYQQGEVLDIQYLAGLSYGATPALAAGLETIQADAKTYASLGAVLACQRADLQAHQDQPWQLINLSSIKASQSLSSIETLLQEYPTSSDKGILGVQVDGEWVPCASLVDYSDLMD